MAGTGIHGYTGTSANGLYNISNGIIQSSSPSTNANDIGFNTGSGAGASAIGSAVANAISNTQYNVASNLASQIAGHAQLDSSDYGDMIREILAASQANTAQSQAFAREQMDYQTKSDATAMAWSANEAAKNRAWQESLADTAHQREVRDLIAAGLNPILATNQGAFTGSGATGQGFSSSGAMGQVDNSASQAMAQLRSTLINTASQASIAGLYVDAEKYAADKQYAASKMNTEASIMNNENTNSTQKYIAMNGFVNDLKKAAISASATRDAAYANAGAIKYSAEQAASASMYGADKNYEAQVYKTDHDWRTNPEGYAHTVVNDLIDIFGGPKSEADFRDLLKSMENPTYGPEFAWDPRSGAS